MPASFMETLVLTATSILSFGVLPLQAGVRALYALFLHLLLVLTVGSFAYRTLSGAGALLVPVVNHWAGSPLMALTNGRVYGMVAISLLTTASVFVSKARMVLVAAPTPVARPTFVDTSYCCLLMLWIHLGAIFTISLL